MHASGVDELDGTDAVPVAAAADGTPVELRDEIERVSEGDDDVA
jgi:hypothetical protein